MMKRLPAALAILLLAVASGCTTPPHADEGHAKAEWSIRAKYTDACSCAPSCPCLFGSEATLGYCEGITLVEIETGHYGDVKLDGVKVLAVYRGGTWIKFYVGDEADEAQTEAAVTLLPTFEDFFAIEDVREVKNVALAVERGDGWMTIAAPDTEAEVEVMKGRNGKPIKVENLPAPGLPFPEFHDHTQYRTITLKHDAGDESFDYEGTNSFTARVEEVAEE